MKKKVIIWFIFGVFISFVIGYTLGSNNGQLSKNESDCLIDSDLDENFIISEKQALCLVNREEVISFHGVSSPFYFPDDFVRLELKSGKIAFVKGSSENILTKNNSDEFQNKLENLGVYIVSK